MISALLSACTPASEIYRSEGMDVAGKDAVIFVHGYYGSALREQGGGRRRFITIPTIIAGSFAIALESGVLRLRPSPELEVEGLLASVSVLPFFYNNDVYGSFIRKLSASHPVAALAYDWRKDLSAAVSALDETVMDLEKRGANSISILAHSMGGLVSAYYLAYGTQGAESAKLDWRGAKHVAKVAFLGVPFGGVMAILRNMQHGTGYSWNKDLLEGPTVASWPASYHLIPSAKAPLLDPEGKEISVSLHDPEFWAQHKLGLLRESGLADAERLAYTRAQLERAKRFADRLQIGEAPPRLRVLSVRGKGRPTLAKGYFDGRELTLLPQDAKKKGLPFAPLEEEGDGSVTLSAAALPAAFAVSSREILSDFAHDRLFADPTVEKECLDFLAREN